MIAKAINTSIWFKQSCDDWNRAKKQKTKTKTRERERESLSNLGSAIWDK